MPVEIIRADADKHSVPICRLVQELADFERMPDGPTVSAETFRQHLLDDLVKAFVAVEGGEFFFHSLSHFASSLQKKSSPTLNTIKRTAPGSVHTTSSKICTSCNRGATKA